MQKQTCAILIFGLIFSCQILSMEQDFKKYAKDQLSRKKICTKYSKFLKDKSPEIAVLVISLCNSKDIPEWNCEKLSLSHWNKACNHETSWSECDKNRLLLEKSCLGPVQRSCLITKEMGYTKDFIMLQRYDEDIVVWDLNPKNTPFKLMGSQIENCFERGYRSIILTNIKEIDYRSKGFRLTNIKKEIPLTNYKAVVTKKGIECKDKQRTSICLGDLAIDLGKKIFCRRKNGGFQIVEKNPLKNIPLEGLFDLTALLTGRSSQVGKSIEKLPQKLKRVLCNLGFINKKQVQREKFEDPFSKSKKVARLFELSLKDFNKLTKKERRLLDYLFDTQMSSVFPFPGGKHSDKTLAALPIKVQQKIVKSAFAEPYFWLKIGPDYRDCYVQIPVVEGQAKLLGKIVQQEVEKQLPKNWKTTIPTVCINNYDIGYGSIYIDTYNALTYDIRTFNRTEKYNVNDLRDRRRFHTLLGLAVNLESIPMLLNLVKGAPKNYSPKQDYYYDYFVDSYSLMLNRERPVISNKANQLLKKHLYALMSCCKQPKVIKKAIQILTATENENNNPYSEIDKLLKEANLILKKTEEEEEEEENLLRKMRDKASWIKTVMQPTLQKIEDKVMHNDMGDIRKKVAAILIINQEKSEKPKVETENSLLERDSLLKEAKQILKITEKENDESEKKTKQ